MISMVEMPLNSVSMTDPWSISPEIVKIQFFSVFLHFWIYPDKRETQPTNASF